MMGFMWFSLGLLVGLSVLGYIELNKRLAVDFMGWAGLLLGEFLILFCIAWSVGSVAEGEPRSGAMGLILFGGLGLLVLIWTWRLYLANAPKRLAR